MLLALISVLIIVVVGAICFYLIDRFVRDARLGNLLKILVALSVGTIRPPPGSRPSLAMASSASAVSRTGAAVTSTAIDRGTASNERR